MKLRILIVIYVLLIPASVFAGEFSFRCEIMSQYELTSEGKLVKPEKSAYYPGASFEVDRTTGKIVGAGMNSPSDFQLKVIDSGNNGSFKVFSFAEQRKVAESLVIIIRDKKNGKMPFVYVDLLQAIVTGTCD